MQGGSSRAAVDQWLLVHSGIYSLSTLCIVLDAREITAYDLMHSTVPSPTIPQPSICSVQFSVFLLGASTITPFS